MTKIEFSSECKLDISKISNLDQRFEPFARLTSWVSGIHGERPHLGGVWPKCQLPGQNSECCHRRVASHSLLLFTSAFSSNVVTLLRLFVGPWFAGENQWNFRVAPSSVLAPSSGLRNSWDANKEKQQVGTVGTLHILLAL